MKFYEIPIELIKIASYTKDNPLFNLSTQYGFTVDKVLCRADLDPGIAIGMPNATYLNRINIIFKENNEHSITNCYQLKVCLLVFITYCHNSDN